MVINSHPMKEKLQRARWHDYTSPCRYMITINKHPLSPPLCIIKLKTPSLPLTVENLYVQWSPIGKIIAKRLYHISAIFPEMIVEQYAIMPDHVHFLLHIRQPLSEHLGFYIARLKRQICHEAASNIFTDGYNDQIIHPSRSLQTIYTYIRENPFRLAVRRLHPDFFTCINNLSVAGTPCQAYGNLQLLDNPFKEAVIIHRSDDAATCHRHREQWLYTAANGGVLVSPFISPAERQIRAEAEALGGQTILLTNRPLAAREKPSGNDFSQCAKGNLLLLAPSTLPPEANLSRATCLTLNHLSQTIATSPSLP